jgi:hypothetical protein
LAFSGLAPGPPNRSVFGCLLGMLTILLVALMGRILINISRLPLLFGVFDRFIFGRFGFLIRGLSRHIFDPKNYNVKFGIMYVAIG